MVSLKPSTTMCDFILILCVSLQEEAYSIIVSQICLLISKSFLLALHKFLCCLLSHFHLFSLAPSVRCSGHLLFPVFYIYLLTKPCTNVFLCPLQNCSSTPLFLLPFHFAPHSSNLVNADTSIQPLLVSFSVTFYPALYKWVTNFK